MIRLNQQQLNFFDAFGWLEGIETKVGLVACSEYDDGTLRLVEGVEMKPVVWPEVTGGTPPLTYSLLGLPPDLAFDSASRTLSGTPTVAGTYEMITGWRIPSANALTCPSS